MMTCELNKDNLILLETLNYNAYEPSLLIKAIKTNNIVLVKKLLEYNINIGIKDNDGNNALLIAVISNKLDIVKMLLESGNDEINIEEEGYKKHTALTYACKKGYKDIVEYLISRGANKSHKTLNGSDGIIYASIYGYIDIIELLLDENTKFVKNLLGNDALMYACKYGHLEIVKLLLLNGANINTTNNLNETPFIVSCQEGHKELVNYLLGSGYDIDYKLNFLINIKTIKELSDRYKWKELLDLFTKKKRLN